jgi:hypothetical protein
MTPQETLNCPPRGPKGPTIMTKTDDLQDAIVILLGEPGDTLTLRVIHDDLLDCHPALREEEPRWIGVALINLRRAGIIGWPGCSPEHHHDGDCVVVRLI